MQSSFRMSMPAWALMATMAAPAAWLATGANAAAPVPAAAPLLATPDQIEGERAIPALLNDPELNAVQAKIRADLLASTIGRTPDGARRVDFALAQWTHSLIFKELIGNRERPVLLWGTDDTPRTWLGYTLGGVGTSGDNPDFIYRSAAIKGEGRYELTGRFDLQRRPQQFVLQVLTAQAPATGPLGKNRADLGNSISTLTDRDLDVKPDGSFRVTIGGPKPADSKNHVVTEAGDISIGTRDILSDWNLRPATLSIRRLDRDVEGGLDTADLRKRVLAKLADYVALWSHYPQRWFGGLQPNSIADPVPREGGWGYLSGFRFQLKPDEAILLTSNPQGAGYAGIQVVDPWMIASSAKEYQTSLNLSQAKPNADGTYTYIISPRDPGVANWLDTSSLHEGYGILRWQVVKPDIDSAALIRDFRVIKLADARKIAGIALITPQQRKAAIAARADGYTNRTR